MFLLRLTLLVSVALTAGPSAEASTASWALGSSVSGAPRYVGGPWFQDPQEHDYDVTEEDPLLPDEDLLPENSTDSEGLLEAPGTTAEGPLLLGEDAEDVQDSNVWKIVLVTAVLLVSLVGCLGTAYYLCIWRGGRIHYLPQKTYA